MVQIYYSWLTMVQMLEYDRNRSSVNLPSAPVLDYQPRETLP